jgi:hypothetical protein
MRDNLWVCVSTALSAVYTPMYHSIFVAERSETRRRPAIIVCLFRTPV